MPKISSRSSALGRLLTHHKAFTTGGGLSAVTDAPHAVGRLPVEWADRYRADLEVPGIGYVALSYLTPIAWVRRDGLTVIPDEHYSATTTRHQSIIRRWMCEGEWS
ncbi:hypothetical protein [Actinomadura oligospora]|uniref:hypothetical protein n=1 Tax=Actinomadura oligospora TaxID=111804 RepID=UPI00047889E3|nr:hypothetical protein [Actinomadura oligospora]